MFYELVFSYSEPGKARVKMWVKEEKSDKHREGPPGLAHTLQWWGTPRCSNNGPEAGAEAENMASLTQMEVGSERETRAFLVVIR